MTSSWEAITASAPAPARIEPRGCVTKCAELSHNQWCQPRTGVGPISARAEGSARRQGAGSRSTNKQGRYTRDGRTRDERARDKTNTTDYIRAASTGDDAHSGHGVTIRRKESVRIQNRGGRRTCGRQSASQEQRQARRPSSPEPVAIPEQKQRLQPTSVEVSTQERERRLARLGQGRGSARVAIVQRAAVTTRQSEQFCVTW